ncbi:MAG: NUMOD4 motif-containing HNH endonuclease [Mycetocola sp.]
MNAIEEWRAVPDWEGLYEISSHGRVRSLRSGRVLKPWLTNFGHRQVQLCRRGRPTGRTIHSLVLEAFVGPRPAGMEGCHNDGDPTNNHPENLRWDTHRANMQDMQIHGTHAQGSRTHCIHGHEFDDVNTYRTPAGTRQCRTCRADRETLAKVSRQMERAR